MQKGLHSGQNSQLNERKNWGKKSDHTIEIFKKKTHGKEVLLEGV